MRKTDPKQILRLMRVRQYVKNLFFFAPMLFDGKLTDRSALLRTGSGFILLCLLHSSIYIFNDIVDAPSDRNHPRKKTRPIASGAVSVKSAAVLAALLAAAALTGAFLLTPKFGGLCLGFIAVNLAYSLKFKHLPLIDVMTIAILFLLRIVSGTVLVTVKVFSPWLYVVTFMLAMFLGFGKRRAELAMLTDASKETRPVLDGYSLPLLDQLITIVSSVTIMAYSLYTFSGPTLPEGNRMMLTIPVVVYGIFRYQYLIQMKHEGGAPEEVLFSDRALQIAIVVYGLIVIFALYL